MSARVRLRDETRRMIRGEEGFDVEFKETVAGLESGDLVAFANAEGGTILLGVGEISSGNGTKTGEIIGCETGDEPILSVRNKANNCRPPVEIEITEEYTNEASIYRINVSEASRKPVCTIGGTYKIRRERSKAGIDPELMTSLILQREEAEFLARFREAGQTIIEHLEEVEARLGQMIREVEDAAREATDAAHSAAEMAEDAAAAAESLER